ncbi:S1/P1 nuclease [Dokdonia sp.]|uniref:S1/P1 nuclease n=1 Tax=Dokdonia sp. TaxID=2024995 RepID=UPI00326548A7
MRYLFLILFLISSSSFYATNFDWGKTGHRTTGAIAEQYLSKKAKKEIAKLLNGQSLAIVSTYADEVKSDKAYRSYGPWHYVNIPFDKSYNTHSKNDRGDIIQGIATCIEVIKDENSLKEDKAFYLKMLIHFIGDLHQPLHTGIGEDKGGNDFQVQWFRDGTNLHRVWDTQMIEHYNMSYSELATTMPRLSKKQVKVLQKGTVQDWMEDSRVLVKDIYENTKKGEKLGYGYMYKYFNPLRTQLQKGGIRLAGLLNELFG